MGLKTSTGACSAALDQDTVDRILVVFNRQPVKQVTFTPHIVAFPFHVVARCLALLLPEFVLLLLDPAELWNREHANGFHAHTLRR